MRVAKPRNTSTLSNDENDLRKDWRKLAAMAEEAHLADDPLAVDACLVACYWGQFQIPEWVFEELIRRSLVNLGVKPDQAKRGGRHTNPHIARVELVKKYKAFAAVKAAEMEGFQGDRKYLLAKRVLEKQQVHYSVETIKKYHAEYKKQGKKLASGMERRMRFEIATLALFDYVEAVVAGREPPEVPSPGRS